MPPSHDPSRRHEHWYQQPVLWLGAAIFIASIAGCVWLIMASLHGADTPLAPQRNSLLGMPMPAPAASAPAAARSSPEP